MSKVATCLAMAFCMAAAERAIAEEHIIEGVVTQWRPLVTFAQPGDTLRFKNMTGHDTETIEGMIPEGATPWKSKLGEEGYSAALDKDGIYIYKCNPHMSTGMVGAVVVGDARPPTNLATLEANLPNITIGRNMVNRTLNKTKQALAEEAK